VSQQLETYDWPNSDVIIAIEDLRLGVTLSPGDFVRHKDCPDSRGIIVANNANSVTVLWSVTPNASPWPIPRRVFGSTIANEIVKVQPMSLPSGLIFYLDYTYGSGSRSGSV